MNVLIVIPPSPLLTDDRVFPFLGPLQIAALARREGHSVRVSDLTGHRRYDSSESPPTLRTIVDESMRILDSDVEEFSPDIVGYYSSTPQHVIVRDMMVRTKDRRSDMLHIAGGPHANVSPQNCIKDGFDYVVMSDQGGGGGEKSFLKLLDMASHGRTGPGIVSEASRTGRKWEHDVWPFPARDLIDMDSYMYMIKGERATSVVTMSGCPFACSYCSHWCGYRRPEGKSPERVEEEIQEIRRVYGYRSIMFYDDEINLRPGFMDDFLPMLRRQGIIWRAFFKSGPNLMSDAVFETMAAAGCVQLCTGAESADQGILGQIHKCATVEDNTSFIKKCVKFGIEPKVFAQVGLPGETLESIQKLRDWAVNMIDEGLEDMSVSITTPMPGSPIYEDESAYDIQFDKDEMEKSVMYYRSAPGTSVSYVRTSSLTRQQIIEGREWVEEEFYRAKGRRLRNDTYRHALTT